MIQGLASTSLGGLIADGYCSSWGDFLELKQWKNRNKKARTYSHFDHKVSLKRVWSYISNPRNVAMHGFYPFIHYVDKSTKYSKNGKLPPKERKLCYSAHIDRYIFQYYGFKLNQMY